MMAFKTIAKHDRDLELWSIRHSAVVCELQSDVLWNACVSLRLKSAPVPKGYDVEENYGNSVLKKLQKKVLNVETVLYETDIYEI